MKKEVNQLLSILLRYLVLIIAGFPSLWIFYLIFTPLTIYPVYFLIKLFHSATLITNFIIIDNYLPIEIINPCIAGSAYYLLLILNLSTPGLKFLKRLGLIFVSFFALLLVNILRIFLLSLLFVSGFSLFDITHELFWYFGSIVFVIGIWFLGVKMFKVREIPFYSDFLLLAKSKLRKKLKKPKRSKKH
ncbi:MAG: pacearchaeosortase [Candidatus Pacearchaeota archaeon]|nr:pacearchaeosortase [Candidatus Pacearchaeota archaeon]